MDYYPWSDDVLVSSSIISICMLTHGRLGLGTRLPWIIGAEELEHKRQLAEKPRYATLLQFLFGGNNEDVESPRVRARVNCEVICTCLSTIVVAGLNNNLYRVCSGYLNAVIT